MVGQLRLIAITTNKQISFTSKQLVKLKHIPAFAGDCEQVGLKIQQDKTGTIDNPIFN